MLNIGDVCTVDFFRRFSAPELSRLNIVEKRGIRFSRGEFEAQLFARFKNADRFIWFPTHAELSNSDGTIQWWDGRKNLCYIDDDHLSEYGAERFHRRLAALLIKLCSSSSEIPN